MRANSHIEWAIDNLVENAIVHATDTPTVEVRVERETNASETGSEWLTVTVLDDGPGIPADEIAVLTDDDKRTTTNHGSGLGLWIAQQIAHAFDGQFEIRQQPETAYSTAVILRFQPASERRQPDGVETAAATNHDMQYKNGFRGRNPVSEVILAV